MALCGKTEPTSGTAAAYVELCGETEPTPGTCGLRIGDLDTLDAELTAWQHQTNTDHVRTLLNDLGIQTAALDNDC